MLLKLPDMTTELAASIVDWRDGDSEVSPGGAESEYYLLLSDPYYCKNGPFETIEEFLLIKGASSELLFGEVCDPNRLIAEVGWGDRGRMTLEAGARQPSSILEGAGHGA